MAVNYSGSQSITGCTITTWTTSTYYSFKLTQDCKLSINGTPAINARAGDEFVIQVNAPYIFDRDTKVLLSYPDTTVIPPSTYLFESTQANTSYSSSGYMTVGVIQTVASMTAYNLRATLMYWSTSTATNTVRIIMGATTLATQSLSTPASAGTLFSFNVDLTTTIPANSTIELQMTNGAVNNAASGQRIATMLAITDKS